VAFETVDRTKLYSSIVEQILVAIESGTIPQGSALPAERTLATRFGVSRASVREAIRVLEHAGVLDVRGGSGTYVTDVGAAKVWALRAQATVAGEHSPLDVIVARQSVEPRCAEIAATGRNERDLARMRATVAEHIERVAEGEDGADPDLAFHVAVAAATHNPVLMLMFERLEEIMRRAPWSELKQQTRVSSEGGERDIREHQAVLTAIGKHDETAAARAMREHLHSVEQDLLAEVVG
jgi:GntR family transcriptional repressor for pyruvate dehydrogenase complex